ncbi:sugar ABC transporter ATP-binding protein [Polaromonas sp.]|uniref:sugar ABC transporter ATP-binding protein n=1 Tax=Polaromonas sp. TaxID=1869339 RepID=UPI00326591E4
MSLPYLVMRNVSKRFPGVAALNRANLSVHAGEVVALMGANGAGKSTLMNVLGGIVRRDSGEVLLDGRAVALRTPRESLDAGIAFVHQELNSVPTLSVAENIFIDDFPCRGGRIDFEACHRRAKELLGRLGSTVDPRGAMGDLSIGDRQLVEIARALRRSPKIVIFDEPTSSLSVRERERLFEVILNLKREGVAIVYITHFIDEVFGIASRVVVMRGGTTVLDGTAASMTESEIVHQMLGSEENERPLRPCRRLTGEPLLVAEGLTRGGALNDVSFAVRAGEIVAIWGLLGAGRTELLRALVGLDPLDSGTVRWRESGVLQKIRPKTLYRKTGFVTEDRRGEGLFLPLSVAENIVMTFPRTCARFGLFRRGELSRFADSMIKRLAIKVNDAAQRVSTLSGGNQQKVVFARWLAGAPQLLLLDEPTRGLDVAAKTEILRLVSELADAGTAVLLVSSELEELTRVADRYLIMVRGQIVGELSAAASHGDLLRALSETAQPAEAT